MWISTKYKVQLSDILILHTSNPANSGNPFTPIKYDTEYKEYICTYSYPILKVSY